MRLNEDKEGAVEKGRESGVSQHLLIDSPVSILRDGGDAPPWRGCGVRGCFAQGHRARSRRGEFAPRSPRLPSLSPTLRCTLR